MVNYLIICLRINTNKNVKVFTIHDTEQTGPHDFTYRKVFPINMHIHTGIIVIHMSYVLIYTIVKNRIPKRVVTKSAVLCRDCALQANVLPTEDIFE